MLRLIIPAEANEGDASAAGTSEASGVLRFFQGLQEAGTSIPRHPKDINERNLCIASNGC